MRWLFIGGVVAGLFVATVIDAFRPASASVPATGIAALTRLEAVTDRNNMKMFMFTETNILAYCSVTVTTRGDDQYEIRRKASNCDAAATEVLKTLEARNVR